MITYFLQRNSSSKEECLSVNFPQFQVGHSEIKIEIGREIDIEREIFTDTMKHLLMNI